MGKKSILKCCYCDQTFEDSEKRLSRHQDLVHKISCNDVDCDRKFVEILDLENHRRKHHNGGNVKRNDYDYFCQYCEKKYVQKSGVTKHELLKHVFRCSYCTYCFVTEKELKCHISKVQDHQIKEEIKDDIREEIKEEIREEIKEEIKEEE